MRSNPVNVLSAWMTLEVLSPQTFRHRSELEVGNRRVLSLVGSDPPWTAGTPAEDTPNCFYQVVLSTIDTAEAFARLIEAYGDSRLERPVAQGEAIAAVVTLDGRGIPINPIGLTISSFAWGLPMALGRNLDRLGAWPHANRTLTAALGQRLQCKDTAGELLPLDAHGLREAYEWLIEGLGLDRDLARPPAFCIRSIGKEGDSTPPAPVLLDSFFLDDLANAKAQFEGDGAPPTLKRYLQVDKPKRQFFLGGQDPAGTWAATELTLPYRFPLARWPGRGRHALVLNQQLAVNAAVPASGKDPLLAVNGPPGTGKTTLLRDIVAANVVERARAMAEFARPEQAFVKADSRVTVNRYALPFYTVAPAIRGFEMLVVSSNNKAVENVTAELPEMGAIAEDATDLRYFKSISDTLLAPRNTWGLMAAVLGSRGNRRTFQNAFWWDRDTGFKHYLDFICSNRPERGRRKRPTNPDRRVIKEECPPSDPNEALERWQAARTRFQEVRRASRDHADRLQAVWNYMHRDAQQRQQLQQFRIAERRAMHHASRPGWLARLLHTRRYLDWRREGRALTETCAKIDRDHADAVAAFAAAAPLLLRDLDTARPAQTANSCSASTENLFEAVRLALGPRLMDQSFATDNHEAQQLRTPWFGDGAQQARDDLFVAAMQLHKAFIDAAAAPLRSNLSLLMDVFGGKPITFGASDGLVQLWASLFLVTPVASSTFASVGHMLHGVPSQSLGWLLVDEAGQALPQSAVGALLRTKRAVVVGDPLQIQPVVTLPDRFTHQICEHFGVNPHAFNAPEASVQTLADAASPFQGRLGEATVGVPLLVHRRCMEPMFSISNSVAYNDLMVSGVRAHTSKITGFLGTSRWIDVRGHGSGSGRKWCQEEGDVVVSMLGKLKELGEPPDLHVITPFRVVSHMLRDAVRTSGVLSLLNVPKAEQGAWILDHIGTVHTFQGREAEAVILVLGAPEVAQRGTRQWAGWRPNLLNVAVSRAKVALYVVGNRDLWRTAGCFTELDRLLPEPAS